MLKAVQVVANGAALLDGACPTWWQRIDVDELAIDHGTTCVLGQLYETYQNGLRLISLFFGRNERGCPLTPGYYGFHRDQLQREEDWPDLDREWRAAIALRKEMALPEHEQDQFPSFHNVPDDKQTSYGPVAELVLV